MNDDRRILVVDGLPETEQVLKAVLEPRGWEVTRLRSDSLQEAETSHPPRLVVLHQNSADDPATAITTRSRWPDVPTVVIGSVEIPDRDSSAASAATSPLPPLFHYSELLQAIDRLLPAEA